MSERRDGGSLWVAVGMPSSLRLGMIFTTDPADPNAISGLPFSAARALERRGCAVVPLDARGPQAPPQQPGRSVGRGARAAIPRVLRDWLSSLRWRRPGCVLDGARDAARHVMHAIADAERSTPLDAIVGICVSVPLAYLSSDLPIVYSSDGTARVILSSYPRYARRSRVYLKECEECEARALQRASAVALAGEISAASAIADYNVPESRVSVVPIGCNVLPEDDERNLPIEPPSRDGVRFLIVASDPIRKRLPFAVSLVESLRGRGMAAELWHVGPWHRSLRSPVVRSLGLLRLSDPADRQKHREALRSTHLSILPSSGEAFGIAPAESACFGRPAIVSDAGGLPTVVRHGATGLVLPLESPLREWADAIEALVDDPARYTRYAIAARERALREFTWDAWAERIERLARKAITERAATRRIDSSRRASA